MARADLLIKMVRSASRGDMTVFRRAVEALAAEERSNQHQILARRLEEALANGSGQRSQAGSTNVLRAQGPDQVFEIQPERALDGLVLPDAVRAAVSEVIEEHHRIELLRSHNLEPRNRLLLIGPPGNGKTSLAEALAFELMLPLFSVRYESVVASYLGETSTRLNSLFEFARTRHCVLFFDEFDTLGKERGDIHETGEIKRVVSSLLLQIDRLPSHVVVVTATNHPELLDRAVWRRFQVRLNLPSPDYQARIAWLRSFSTRSSLGLEAHIDRMAEATEDASFGELEELAIDTWRRCILDGPDYDLVRIIRSRLDRWGTRAKIPAPPD